LAVYAWALLPNHAHLLLRTGSRPLPRIMGDVVAFVNLHRARPDVGKPRAPASGEEPGLVRTRGRRAGPTRDRTYQ
jgi:hypothetical protein